jgi:hypothetical protein
MADELEKTCENCKYEFESCEWEHCRHCIHSAEEHFEPKIIVPTEAEIRAKAIDEFAERMKQLNEEGEISVAGWNRIVDNIAEKMKAGVTNE